MAYLSTVGFLSWIARDSAKPGRAKPGRASTANSAQETWVLHASSQWSEAHVDDDKSIVSEHMLAAFLKLVNADAAAVQKSYHSPLALCRLPAVFKLRTPA